MKILREWLGGSEIFDLDNVSQREEFIRGVVQDHEVGEELIAEIARDGWAVVNQDEPEYIERYTRLED